MAQQLIRVLLNKHMGEKKETPSILHNILRTKRKTSNTTESHLINIKYPIILQKHSRGKHSDHHRLLKFEGLHSFSFHSSETLRINSIIL